MDGWMDGCLTGSVLFSPQNIPAPGLSICLSEPGIRYLPICLPANEQEEEEAEHTRGTHTG